MPETFVFDYSFARPDPVSMKVSGADGVVRYLAPLPNTKVIDAAERDRLLAAGLSITLIWESVAQRALAGANAGTVDAHTAIGMAQALGYPDNAAIYFCLEDPSKLPRSQWPKVLAYIEAVAAVGGPYRRGGYGSQDLVEETLRQGFISKGWQVEGWSAGVSLTCHLFQRSNSRSHPFPGTDENVCLQDDWGQWSPNQPPEEDDMAPAKLYAFPDSDNVVGGAKNRGLVTAHPVNGARPWWIPSNDALALERIIGAVEATTTVITDANQQAAILAMVAWSR